MKTLKILGKSWDVVPLLKESDGSVYYGKTHYLAQKIAINPRASRHQRLDTTIHEAIHVIDGELKIGLTERDVSCLSTALCGFVLDNPGVFRQAPLYQKRAKKAK